MKLSKNQKGILRFFGIRIAGFLINVLLKTVRISLINSDAIKKLEKENKNYIVAFWHGSMLIGWYLQKHKNFAALVSKSKDGEVLTSVLEKWNFNVVRGSSNKGGHDALDLMIHLTEENFHLAITPDGPTGPIHKMKPGAVIVSYRSQIPLILIGIGIKKKWTLKSWDLFEIPKPFTKVYAVFSKPLIFDTKLSREGLTIEIEKVEIELNSLQKEANNKW